MVGDDCCKGAAYTREVRDAYETLRRFDPFHVAAGAFECGEMHSFQEPLLAVDLPMRENYRPDLPSHAGDAVGGEFAFAGGDGALRLAPMRWEPIVNMPQPCRQATGRAVVAEAFVGLVTGDLVHLNWYVFNRQQGFERWPLLPYVDEANALVNELLPHLMRGERREIRVAAEDLLEPSRPAVVRAAAYALDGCVRVVAVNAGDAPARATLAVAGAAGAAQRLFDANVSRPVVNGAFSDVLDGLGTKIWSLGGCDVPAAPPAELVSDGGFEWVQNPTVPAYVTCADTPRRGNCFNYDMHSQHWTLPAVDDGRDGKVWLSVDGARPFNGRRAGRLTLVDDEPVRVPVPGAGLDAYGPPLGFGLDLGALGTTGAVRVSLAAFSNPPGSTLAIAAGAWDPAPADPEHAASPSEPWRGAPAGAPCVLGPAYATCAATIDLADLPATPSGKVGLVLEIAGGPGHVYLDDVSATLVA